MNWVYISQRDRGTFNQEVISHCTKEVHKVMSQQAAVDMVSKAILYCYDPVYKMLHICDRYTNVYEGRKYRQGDFCGQKIDSIELIRIERKTDDLADSISYCSEALRRATQGDINMERSLELKSLVDKYRDREHKKLTKKRDADTRTVIEASDVYKKFEDFKQYVLSYNKEANFAFQAHTWLDKDTQDKVSDVEHNYVIDCDNLAEQCEQVLMLLNLAYQKGSFAEINDLLVEYGIRVKVKGGKK